MYGRIFLATDSFSLRGCTSQHSLAGFSLLDPSLGSESGSAVAKALYFTPDCPLSFSADVSFFSKKAYKITMRNGHGIVVNIVVLGARHNHVVRAARKNTRNILRAM